MYEDCPTRKELCKALAKRSAIMPSRAAALELAEKRLAAAFERLSDDDIEAVLKVF